MTRKKFIRIVAITIWILGAVYLAPRAIEELRTDIIDNIEGRATHDGESLWNSLRGIMFPSFLLRDEE